MADVFQQRFLESQNKKDPFQRMVDATQRNSSKIQAFTLPDEIQSPDVNVYDSIQPHKSVGDHLQDLAVTGLKAAVAVPQTAVGLADLVDYGMSTATKGYQEIGAVLGLNERPDYEIQTGRIGNFLEENTWLRFKEAQQALDSYKSEESQKQQREYQQLAGLSTDKSLSDNWEAFKGIVDYAVDNPSLPVLATAESLPSMFMGGVLGRGAGAGISALEGRAIAQAGLGEGLVMAGAQQESIRSQTPGGLTTPEQSNLALVTGGIGGLIGAAGGRIANKLGLEDIETSIIQRQAGEDLLTQAANRSALTKAAGSVIQNSAEEFAQTIPESLNENVALDRPLLDQVGQNVVLATMAGGLTSAGMSTLGSVPSAVNTAVDKAQQLSDKANKNLTQTSYEDLSNPTHEKYNPTAAFNNQLKFLDSNNQDLRQRAEANISKITENISTSLETAKGDFAEAYSKLEQAQQLGDTALIESAQQGYDLAVAEYRRLNQHYLDLEDAKQKYETNKDTGTTSEGIKSNVSTLIQDNFDSAEQESAVNHVKNFMSQYDSDDLLNLAENSIYFTPEQKTSLRQLAEVKVLQNQNKGTSQVANDVIFGLKGGTKLQSHRGLQDYEKLVERGVRVQDNQLIESSLTDLETWATSHSNKADTLVQAYDKVKDTNQVVQVVPVGNGQWRINTDTSTFLSGKERNETGAINVHKGSNSTKHSSVGLIDQVQQEAALISTTYNALSSYASSFSQNSDLTTNNNIDTQNQQIESNKSANLGSLPVQDQMTSFESENGITHSIPNTLLDQTHTIKDVSSELNAVSSPTDLLDKQYSDNLLLQLQQAVPDAKINIVSDLNIVQDRGLKAGLKSGGWYIPDTGVSHIAPQADDWHGSVKELINHELIHRATHEALQKDEKAKETLRDLSDRIREYIMTNPDTMALMDEVTEDRIDYMYRSLDEMLAVGIAETSVRKLLPTIIGEDGLKSLDSVFQSLLSGGRYDSVRTTPRGTSVSSNGDTKNTKSRITTEVSESSSTNTGSQNNQRDESDNSSNVQGSQRKKSAVVEAPGAVSGTESKPTGLITALRGATKATRTKERSKPFKERNLVTAHFNQNVDTNNPLVLVSNFVGTLEDNLKETVQKFVKNPVTEVQEKQLQDYLDFHKEVSSTIKQIFLVKPEKVRYRDYTSFLVNADNQLDENTLTALTLAAYSTFIETGLKTLNTNAEIAELLHLDEDTYIPNAVAEQYRDIGQQRAVLIHALGKKAAQFLGLKVRRDSDPKFQSSLEGSLGGLIYMALRTQGLVQETTVPGKQHAANMSLVHTANGKEYVEPKELGFEYAYARTTLKNGEVIPRIKDVIEKNQDTKGFLSKLFGNDVGLREPKLEQPKTFDQTTISRTSSTVPSVQAEYIEQSQKNGFKIRTTVSQVMQRLFNQNKDYLLSLLGIAVTPEVLDSIHISERDNFKAKAENEQRALTNAFTFINGLEFKNGEYQTFWDTQYTSANNRMYYNSNLFNVQTQQIHRALAGLEGFKTTFDPNQSSMTEDGTVTDYGKFLRGIAENMEGIENNRFFQEQLPTYTYRTVDKVASKDFLPAFEAYLNQDYVQAGISAMASYISTQELTDQQRSEIKTVVDEAGMGVQSLYALITLAEHYNAVTNKDTEFTTYIGLGSDGVNNGVAIANVLTGLANPNMRMQVGLIPVSKDQDLKTYFDTKEQGIPDYYVEFADVINSHWQNLKSNLDSKKTQVLEALFSSWGKRKMAKVWAVPLNYNAGFTRLKSVMAEQFITDIYAQMTKIANLAKQVDKQSVEYQNAVNLRNTLEANLSEVLGQKVSLPNPEQLNDWDFGMDSTGKTDDSVRRNILNTLFNTAFNTFGDAATAATKEFAGNYLKSRDLSVATHKAAFKIYSFVKTKVREKIISDMVKQGLIESGEYESLSTDEQNKVDKQLLEYAPVLVSTLSNISDNKLESGLMLTSNETRLNQDDLNQLQISHRNLNGGSKTQNIRVGVAERTETSIGIGGLALQVQSVDAGVSATTIGNTKSINVHDQNSSGISDIEDMGKIQNKAFFELVGFYRSQAENLDMLIRTLNGVRDLAKEYNISSNEFGVLLREVLGVIPQGKQYVNQEQQGLLTTLNSIGFNVDNNTKMAQVLDILTDVAYGAEQNKVGMLLDTYAIHQYAGEGGEFVLTDEERNKLTKEAQALHEAKQKTHEAIVQLADDLRLAVQGKFDGHKQVEFKSTKLTPLQSWFEQRIDNPIELSELLETLDDKLSPKEQIVLSTIRKLLPNNLVINYFNAASIPEHVPTEDVDVGKVHAWYNLDTNTINIKSVASKGSKVDSSTVLHELLHAALAQRIEVVRSNPSAHPEAKKALDDLEALRKELLQRYQNDTTIKGMLENLDEFISYGLTEPTLQDLMQSVMVDRSTRTKSNLKSMFKAFVDSLASLLGFRSKQIHALGAFIHDTALLIQSLEPIKPEPTVGMLFSQHTFNAQSYVQGMDSLDVFEQLDSTGVTTEHNQHLNRVIQSTIGTFYNRDAQAKVQMDQVLQMKSSDAITAGFSMSDKEAYTQEAVKQVLDTFIELHSGGLIGGQISKTFKVAQAQIKVEDFFQGDWAKATENEQDTAQAMYDYVFGMQDKQYLSRFMSMAISNENFRKLLQGKMPKEESKRDSWFDRLVSIYHYAVSWLNDKYARLSPTNSLSQRMDKLLNQLTYLDTKARQHHVQWYEYSWNLIGKVTDPLNKVSGGAANYLFNRNLIRNNRFKVIRILGKIASLTPSKISIEIPQEVKRMRDQYKPNERLGAITELVSEVSSPSTLKNIFDKLIRQTNQNAQHRQAITDGTKRAILSGFTENGKHLTKADHKAITYSVLRTDVQSLVDAYGVDEVTNFIKDSRLRSNEANELEQQILANPNGNDMLIRAKQLAYYMVTNKGGEGLVKNTVAIASGIDTAYQGTIVDRSDSLVQKLDMLVSLYAIEYVDKGDLTQTIELLKKEPDGIKQVIQLHSELVKDAYTDFEKNPLSYTKGYMPELVNPYREIAIATSAIEKSRMEKEGWKFISTLKQDPNDVEAERYLMVHTDRGYQRIVSGAVDLMDTARKGTEAISRSNPNFLKVTKARQISAMRRAKQNYQSYDPSKQEPGLIASYDTDGLVLAYNYEMSGHVRNKYLERNQNFADLLGSFAGMNYYKPVNEAQQNKVVDVLYEDYKKNYSKDPNAYVFLSPHSTDPKIVEMWRMLPFSFREEAINAFGKGNPIVVRNDILNIAFGFKKYSVAQIFDKASGERNTLEKIFVGFTQALLGDSAQGKIAKFEHAVQEIVRLAKDIIVIRSILVLWGNVKANFLMLAVSGINPLDVLKDWASGMYNARKYQKTKERLIDLETKLKMGGNSLKLENEIAKARYELQSNPLTPYIDAGMLSSIVEDVAIQQGDYTYTSEFKKKVAEYTKWIPSPVKTTAEWLMVSPSTAPYQFLASTTQLSDFVSKYSLAKYHQKNGMSFEEAITEASQTFINYDVPTSKAMQYMNDVGLFMFTKFFLRIQAVLLRKLEKKAASVIGQHMAVEMFTNVQGILDPLMINRLGNNPFEGSAASIFGAIGENPIINALN